jgi:hypothetical protein
VFNGAEVEWQRLEMRRAAVAERPIEQMTLREMFSHAERISRDLVDHLERNLLPRSRQLARLVRPTETESFPADVEDVTVRSHVARLIESEDFTDQVYGRLADFCEAIDASASRIVDDA